MRNVVAIAISLAAATIFSACNKGGENNGKNGNGNGNTEQTLEEKEAAAFAQFGLDLEQVKPNAAAPYEVTIKYGNEVSQTVYYRKAAWKEKSETDISSEIGNAYNERMFNYMKSVAADKKIYTNKTLGNPVEIENYSYFTSGRQLLITWSYKYNAMWIDVYLDYNTTESEEIGLSMNGSGSY